MVKSKSRKNCFLERKHKIFWLFTSFLSLFLVQKLYFINRSLLTSSYFLLAFLKLKSFWCFLSICKIGMICKVVKWLVNFFDWIWCGMECFHFFSQKSTLKVPRDTLCTASNCLHVCLWFLTFFVTKMWKNKKINIENCKNWIVKTYLYTTYMVVYAERLRDEMSWTEMKSFF